MFDELDRLAEEGALEELIRSARKKVPLAVGLDLLMRMARFAAENGDGARALELAKETRKIVDENRWLPEHEVPVLARLAELRHAAGDGEGARADAAFALASDPAAQLQRVELYVDEQLLQSSEPEAGPQARYRIATNWLARGIGWHKFVAIAYRAFTSVAGDSR